MPIIHKIDSLYKDFYNLRKCLNKTDRYGLYSKNEELLIDILQFSVEAALSAGSDKLAALRQLRLKVELAKRLIRIMHDLKIITLKIYLNLEMSLQEISKMATGWQKYSTNKES